MPIELDSLLKQIEQSRLGVARGRIIKIIGLVIESQGPVASIGELCDITQGKQNICQAEVVGFRDNRTLLMPLGSMEGIRPGMEISTSGGLLSAPVGMNLLGRVIDGLGKPMDNKGPLYEDHHRPIYAEPPNAMARQRISTPMLTGIRAIDGFLTVGRGQRMGIFAGSGVGKSVTMGMIARNCLSPVNVIALIGERGREVREFIEKDLGPEGMQKSVVIVATSDQPALVRLKASLLAMTIAEYFRDQGQDVLFMLDSSTRLAMAQREIGLAVGEPPATKGYTPSVFAFIPKLMERAGYSDKGSITGLYTVLVEGDDMDDPIADTVRSILDGHIVLDRKLASKNHYPAISVLHSISRCRNDVISDEHKKMSGALLRSMAIYQKSEDLINIGAYVQGSDAETDQAIQINPAIEKFLIQGMDEKYDTQRIEDYLQVLSQALASNAPQAKPNKAPTRQQ
jgi:flagellum-specific ATP synthase